MVGLHSTADPSGQPFVNYPEAERIVPMLVRAVVYTARTELFLMISVFLLLMSLDRRPRPYGRTIAQQARRLLVPFLFWVVFYAFYNLVKASWFGYDDAIRSQLLSPLSWVGYLLLGSVKYHMHFLPTLFGLVLMYPLFRKAVEHPWLGVMVLGCLLARREIDLFLWSSLRDWPAFPFVLRAVKILSYAGYGIAAGALLGLWYRWKERPAGGRDWLPVIAYAGGVLFLIKLIATWRTVKFAAWPFDYAAGYWADFLMPIVLFLGAMSLAHGRWPQAFTRFAPYSFGIYLCHPIFLDLIEIALTGTEVSPTTQVFVKIAGALGATSVLVALVARTPALAWTIGLGPLPRLRVRPRVQSHS